MANLLSHLAAPRMWFYLVIRGLSAASGKSIALSTSSCCNLQLYPCKLKPVYSNVRRATSNVTVVSLHNFMVFSCRNRHKSHTTAGKSDVWLHMDCLYVFRMSAVAAMEKIRNCTNNMKMFCSVGFTIMASIGERPLVGGVESSKTSRHLMFTYVSRRVSYKMVPQLLRQENFEEYSVLLCPLFYQLKHSACAQVLLYAASCPTWKAPETLHVYEACDHNPANNHTPLSSPSECVSGTM